MKQFFMFPEAKSYDWSSNQQFVYISKVNREDINHPRTLHSHDDLVELILITEGEGKIFIGDQYFDIKKGSLVIYNSHIVHDELFSSEPIALYCIGIRGVKEKELRENALISDTIEPIFETKQYYDLLLPLFQTAFEILEKEVSNYTEIVQQLGRAIIALIKKNIINDTVKNVEESSKLQIVKEIKEYMDSYFSEDFKLNTFNKNGRWPINEFYFAHKFRELYDYSPIEYLQRRRIGEAQTLLINTDLSITTIAYQVGFNSSSYFTTLFKKVVNLSPRVYRNQYTER